MPFQTNIGSQPLGVSGATGTSGFSGKSGFSGASGAAGGAGSLSLETPTGDVDGVNDAFVFSAPPIFVTYQGVIQDLTEDYTLVGSTVTFVVPPAGSAGDVKGLVSS